MKPAHLTSRARAAFVTVAVVLTALAAAPPSPAQSGPCEADDVPSAAAVRIDRPRPLTRVSGTVPVSGDVQTLPTEPVDQVELYADDALVATSSVAGSDVSFRFDWDSRSWSGRTTLRVVACGARSYGAATVVVEVDDPSGATTSTLLPLPTSTTTTTLATSASTTTTTAAVGARTSTTIIRPTTTTTTTPKGVTAPRTKPGEDSLSLRAVQPPPRVRRQVTSDQPTPTWPALVTVAGGLVGLTVAIAPGRRWLALVGIGRRGDDAAVIPPEPGATDRPS